MDPTLRWIDAEVRRPAGHRRGQQAGPQGRLRVRRDDRDVPHPLPGRAGQAARPGTYRNITGNEATALGLPGGVASSPTGRCSTARTRSRRPATSSTSCRATRRSGSRPSRPRTRSRPSGRPIGAAYGGALGLTASSGPGIALKTEAMGLAVMVELPLVVIDVQRAGPSTGHADEERAGGPAPGDVRAQLATRRCRSSRRPRPASASTWRSRRARLALKYMTPVVYLSDAFLATGSEPWRVPTVADLPGHPRRRTPSRATATFRPYQRDPETLARPWAVPGTPGLEHRIGGLEKADVTGNVSYDPDNHHRMQLFRRGQGGRHRQRHPAARGLRAGAGDLLILGWGSTYGAIRSRGRSACRPTAGPSPTPTCATSTRSRPTPRRSCGSYRRVLIPEVNLGQLLMLIRARYLDRRRRLRPGPRQAVPHRRDRRRGRAASLRERTA